MLESNGSIEEFWSFPMFERVEVDSPTLDRIADRFRGSGEFHSLFFCPTMPDNFYPNLLSDFLQSNFLNEAIPGLRPINLSAAMKSAQLDRNEFEGSFVSKLVAGTCTESVVEDEVDARIAVRKILEDTHFVRAFRMDDSSWSALTNGATLDWTYIAFSSERIAWLVCFADHY